jgi:plastocyanin
MEESNVPPQPIEGKKGIKPIYIFGGLIVVGLIAALVVIGGKKSSSPQAEPLNVQANPQTESATQAPSGPVKEFTVDGSSYKFDPETITVNQGDTVKITFRDSGGPHDLVIDGYNVRTKIVTPGKEDSVTFVADKSGSFKYYCSVANHEALGMTGTLIVQ